MTQTIEHHVLVVMRAEKAGRPALQLIGRPHDYRDPPRWRAQDQYGIFGGPIVQPDAESKTSGETAVQAAIRNVKGKFKLDIGEADVTFLKEVPVQSDGFRYSLVEIDLDVLKAKGLDTNNIVYGSPFHYTEHEIRYLIGGQTFVHEVTAALVLEMPEIFFGDN